MQCQTLIFSGHAVTRMFERAITSPDPALDRRFQNEKALMKCVICKQGEIAPGTATVTLRRGECILIFKNVPADICDNCAEYYLSEAVTEKLLQQADAAIRDGAEQILRFAA
jgi:YgiT-type zinc finger domain-containing protein